jgi:protein tyrosine phosphatase (PTP) superfamily phosphohydrolase (DUF442 family)
MIPIATWLVVAALAIAQTPQTPAAPPIRNFLRISSDFCTGGQPRPEEYAQLKAEGVRAVLSLRPPGEYRFDDEVAAVKAAGMKFFDIPVAYTAPTDEEADEFLKITDDPANRPMFIHCTAAIRAGAFWMIRRIVRDRWSWDDALAEARKVGLVGAPHLEDFVKNYVAKRQGKPGPAAVAGAASPAGGEWTGKVLTGIVAIGGETTGIVLETAQGRLELQCDAAQRATIESLKGQQVTIRGKLETRAGVEIPERKIIAVTEIIRR